MQCFPMIEKTGAHNRMCVWVYANASNISANLVRTIACWVMFLIWHQTFLQISRTRQRVVFKNAGLFKHLWKVIGTLANASFHGRSPEDVFLKIPRACVCVIFLGFFRSGPRLPNPFFFWSEDWDCVLFKTVVLMWLNGIQLRQHPWSGGKKDIHDKV